MSLEVPPQTVLAIVGPSGAGKSTLCRLLVRFYDPQRGVILLDGKDIRGITLRDLRRSVLFLPQNEYVMSGTILENITYGLNSIPKDRLQETLKKAAVDFLPDLPDGLNTRVGEGGLSISAGETQRIALARAFLINPKVVILDEATSFIDAETEEKIKRSLLNFKQTSTVIIVAHRPSTVSFADRIAVMREGRIIRVDHVSKLEADIVSDSTYFDAKRTPA